MPELPEVEIIRRGLETLIVGKRIVSIEASPYKSFPNSQQDVEKYALHSIVTGIGRRAKIIIIKLTTRDNQDYCFVIHLKMTGQMVFRGEEAWGGGHPNDSLLDSLPDRSTRVEITFSDDSKLFFNDQRKFGWMILMKSSEVDQLAFIKKAGPEPLGQDKAGITAQYLQRLSRKRRSPIKAALLDQTVVAGIGNIYADEALFLAGVHPQTKVDALSIEQQVKILEAAIDVMQLSISLGGSTDRNYIDAQGRRGSYLTFAKVFRREGQPCRVCGTAIEKIRVVGRGTHICPNCQKLKVE